MVVKQLQPPTSSSNVSTGSGKNVAEEPESNAPIATTEKRKEVRTGRLETTPRQAPKMASSSVRKRLLVPNYQLAPVQSPLLLRVNPLQSAVVAHISGSRLSTPLEEVQVWKAETRQSARYRLAPSAEMPLLCTFVMQPHVANVAAHQHIINAPVLNVIAFCLPPKQKVKKEHISRRLGCAHLMLAPLGPLQAEKLRPLWETVTFTIAFGKHVAIEYRIPKLATLKNVIYWTAPKPHPIILTTVEKSDR
ncbi:hypothetical protein COOONC_03873 [Cooperia oncophora]